MEIVPMDLSKVMTIRSSQDLIEAKYQKLDDAGIINLVEMAKDGSMKDSRRIAIALDIAKERGLVTIEG